VTPGFLDHMRVVPDHRIPGMVTHPLDEIRAGEDLIERIRGISNFQYAYIEQID